MKTPTKSELYSQIAALEDENFRLRDSIEADLRVYWNKRISNATKFAINMIERLFPNSNRNITFEHVDTAGYWFKFNLVNDARWQTYCVRHSDF